MDSIEVIQKYYVDIFEPVEIQEKDYLQLSDMVREYGVASINAPQFENRAYAYLDDNGVPLMLFGNQREWRGKDRIWVQISRHMPPRKWPKLWKLMKRWIAELMQTSWRVEAEVVSDYPEGVRALEILGFKREGFMLKYTPDGKDCYMYALVR